MEIVQKQPKLNEIIKTTLRDYQSRVVTATWRWFQNNKVGNPLLKVPTGGGKTYILAQLIIDALSFRSEKKIRIIVLTQDTTLVKQNSQKFQAIAPQVDSGVFSAKLGLKQKDNQVTFASIQSVYNKDIGLYDLVIVDEAHQIPEKGDGIYRTFIKHQKANNPRVRVVGLTATDYRLSSGKLTEGKNRLFTEIAAEVTLQELLDIRYLVPIRYPKTSFTVSMQNVKLKGKDYNQDAAAKEMMLDNRTIDALTDSIKRSKKMNLTKWKIYCSNVLHCWTVHHYLEQVGITSAVIDGKTKQSDRDQILLDYSEGKYTALISCETLLTGFDEPGIDHIINLKPTTSKGRWVQLCGRGMRPNHRGEENEKMYCVLSDYTPNTELLGKADMIDYSIDYFEDKSSVHSHIVRCPDCGMALNRYDQHCDHCNFNFMYNRALIVASEAVVSHCQKSSQEIPDGLNLISIRHFDIKPIQRNGKDILQIRFFGNEALEKYNERQRPLLSEFIPFNEMNKSFLGFFTNINLNQNFSGLHSVELMKQIVSHINLPSGAIVQTNNKGYNEAVAYIKPCPLKLKLHWQYSNEEVMQKLFAA